jgi:hypothetical protein
MPGIEPHLFGLGQPTIGINTIDCVSSRSPPLATPLNPRHLHRLGEPPENRILPAAARFPECIATVPRSSLTVRANLLQSRTIWEQIL